MKLHWGHKLGIAFVVFAAFIFYLISVMLRQEIDMVTDDYYAKELTFQQTIDARNRAGRLAGKVSVERDSQQLLIRIPACGEESTGTILFYKPDDPAKDVVFELAVNSRGEQRIAAGRLGKGLYELTVQWNTGGVEYECQQAFLRE